MPPGFGSVTLVLCVVALAPVLVDLLPGTVRIPQVVVLLVLGILVGPRSWAGRTRPLSTCCSRSGSASCSCWPATSWTRRCSASGPGTWRLVVADQPGAGRGPGQPAVRGRRGPLAGDRRDRADHDRARHPAADPARQRHARAGRSAGTCSPRGRSGSWARSWRWRSSSAAGGPGVAIAMLVVFAAIAWAIAVLPAGLATPGSGRSSWPGSTRPRQTTLRISIALLVVLLWSSAQLGFDDVLGAFVAGMVLRRWSPGHVESLERKLDAVGYGFFIPIFFVYSGMTLDMDSIVQHPMAPFVLLASCCWRSAGCRRSGGTAATCPDRAGPGRLPQRDVAAAARRADRQRGGAGTMTPAAQAAGIGAGVVSVLVFPIVAIGLQRRKLRRSRVPTVRQPDGRRRPDESVPPRPGRGLRQPARLPGQVA